MSRYIDADEAKRQIQKATMGQCDVMKVFLNTMYSIDKIPTADVRENVKGEWVRIKDTVQCSQCKAKWIDHTYLIETFRFCPNCGADMRGDNND